nr:DUF3043 domain-containing protein [Acaricomes phytoseiuli]
MRGDPRHAAGQASAGMPAEMPGIAGTRYSGGVFGRNKTMAQTQQPEVSAESPEQRDPRAGKGAPTPTRKEQEAARKRPLVPNDRNAAKQAEREARRESQMRTRAALDTGDERFLPPRDKGPQRRFVRNLIDARTGPGEFVMIVMLVIAIGTLFMPTNVQVQSYVFMAFWLILLIVVIDSYLLARRIRKQLTAKFGADAIERGVVWYGIMRSIQFRRLRLPKPQVRRGEKLED